jgi:hypothetical protein
MPKPKTPRPTTTAKQGSPIPKDLNTLRKAFDEAFQEMPSIVSPQNSLEASLARERLNQIIEFRKNKWSFAEIIEFIEKKGGPRLNEEAFTAVERARSSQARKNQRAEKKKRAQGH